MCLVLGVRGMAIIGEGLSASLLQFLVWKLAEVVTDWEIMGLLLSIME